METKERTRKSEKMNEEISRTQKRTANQDVVGKTKRATVVESGPNVCLLCVCVWLCLVGNTTYTPLEEAAPATEIQQ